MLRLLGKRLSRLSQSPWDTGLGLLVIPMALLAYNLTGFDLNGGPPHHFSEHACLGCHFTVPMIRDGRPHKYISPIDVLCIKCHKDVAAISHVVNVAPNTRPPAFLPLDADGNMTCATCHDPHMPYKDPATGKKTYFLRGYGTGKWSCAVCHEGDPPIAPGATHKLYMHRAHWHPAYSLFTGFDRKPGCKPGKPGELDSLSVECLGCHDTSEWAGRRNECKMVFVESGISGRTHRIGLDYYETAHRNKGLRYRDLDPRVLLFDGRIGCGTCHDPFRPGRVALRIGSAEDFSELCSACHLAKVD